MALVAEIESAFGALDFDEIAKRLNDADQVWAPVQTPAEVASDPQAAAAGAWVEVEDGQGGTYRSPAAPAVFPGADMGPRPAYPGIGQDTRTVLAELGYSASDIDAMIADGAAT
jgi:crotonobetainyl-CoA:carnitine CoA-transferase CaiB-like acyl-CoA transferase